MKKFMDEDFLLQNDTAKQLYHQADIALYQAKQNGRGRYVVFEEGMMHPSD